MCPWDPSVPEGSTLSPAKEALLAARLQGTQRPARIQPQARSGAPPASFAQRRLWFLEQLGGLGAAYHIPWQVRIRGPLDREALLRALDRIVARHESLRTTFVAVAGEPIQQIAAPNESRFALVEHELDAADGLADLRRVAADEAAAPFDLARGPLIRGRLVRLRDQGATDDGHGSGDHALLVTMHHIVSDAWSMRIFLDELRILYEAFHHHAPDPLPPLAVQYADYAIWQRDAFANGGIARHTAYWRETLTGAPALLELPTDRERPPRQQLAGAGVRVRLDAAVTSGLRALGTRHGTTLFMTVLAGWAIVLSRLARRSEVVIGMPVANRDRVELDRLIGFFVNALPVRIDLSGAPTVSELLRRVKERTIGAQEHQALPFELLVDETNPVRTLAYNPIFQSMFAWRATSRERLTLPELDVTPLRSGRTTIAKFDLTLALTEVDGQLVGGLEYATALWDAATIERFAGYLTTVLGAMAAGDDAIAADLPMLGNAEWRQLVEEWSAPAPTLATDGRDDQTLLMARTAQTPEEMTAVLRRAAVERRVWTYILDQHSDPVAIGAVAELCIGGLGALPVDWNRPALVAERLVPDPFGPAGSRLYRTGDAARWRHDGIIELVSARAPSRALGGGADVSAYEAPQDDLEAAAAEIWEAILGVPRVGRRDNFFALGGHSLLATRVVAGVWSVLDLEVGVASLFQAPVLMDWARVLGEAAAARLPGIVLIARTIDGIPESAPPPSFAQRRMFFLEQLGGAGPAYRIAWQFSVTGPLNREALRRALDRIVARHESLRTAFVAIGGEPAQIIAPAAASAFALREIDLRNVSGATDALGLLVEEDTQTPFDLARGLLVRGHLVALADNEHTLLIAMHHIVFDAWSAGVFFDELRALYAAFDRGEADPLPPLTVQYGDYAAWQHETMTAEALTEQAAYWRRALAGAPERLELPTDHPRPSEQDYAGGAVGIEIDAPLAAELRALSARQGTTLFMTVLAGWAIVLSRLANQSEVVIGTPTAGRVRLELDALIGLFVNTLALRVDLTGAPSVSDLLQRVKERALAAQQHQSLPFEQVVELVQPARSMAHSPVFQVMLAWHSEARGQPELPGVRLGLMRRAAAMTTKFDLVLNLREVGDRVVGDIQYATSLFERSTIERHVGYLRQALQGMAADDRARVDRLALLSNDERARVVVEWNATAAPYPSDRCVQELVEAQAARTPAAVAVSATNADGAEERLTYAALDALASQLAQQLRSMGVRPHDRVAICLERTPAVVVAMLAVLKAGGAYVPFDPSYPAERLHYMLMDCAPMVVLTQAPHAAIFDGVDLRVVDVPAALAVMSERAASGLQAAAIGVTPVHPAYVLYTSGSTGRPKGVVVPHRALVNQTVWQLRTFALSSDDIVLQRTSMSFDASVWEFWTPLSAGARVQLLPSALERDPAAIGRFIAHTGVTIAQFVPTLLEAVARGSRSADDTRPTPVLTGCRYVFCGGEPLTEAVVSAALESGAEEVINLYGPTETTINASAERCMPGTRPSIGRPVMNVRFYVLDVHGAPTPVGVRGELYIGGVQLALGYLNRPGLTAERFVPDELSGETGARLYRTGDAACWRADGTLDFLGRVDTQVKVRGHRIELGEIEARLMTHAAVTAAVVAVREDVPGDPRLVAYYVDADTRDADAPDAEVLRTHLAGALPGYMVPAAFVRLTALPLTPSGKVDRNALPAPTSEAYAAQEYEAPVGEIETQLAELWSELLGVERIGRWDDFFALGGHSFLVATLLERMRRRGLRADVKTVFRAPQLAALAAMIVESQDIELAF